MAGMSKFVESLPEGYGYVIFSAVGSQFVAMWMAINVGKARKKYEVEYPTIYHPDNNHVFNCIQRAYQNTLEGNSSFLMMLLLGGLQYPKICAGAGLACMIFRVLYAKSYYTEDPDKRRWRRFIHIAEIVLLGSTISLACHQLKLWPKIDYSKHWTITW